MPACEKPVILVFDFDGVFTKTHIFSEDYLHPDCFRNKDELLAIIREARAKNILLAAATENTPEILRKAYAMMGMAAEEIDSFTIQGPPSFEGKNLHIKNLLKQLNIMSPSDCTVILVEDSQTNVEWALRAGHQAVYIVDLECDEQNATKADLYLSTLEQIIAAPAEQIPALCAAHNEKLGVSISTLGAARKA